MTTIKTKDELIVKLKEIFDRAEAGESDAERDHGDADDALLEYIGDHRVKALYDGIEKWYA